jgi:hypothetical protein
VIDTAPTACAICGDVVVLGSSARLEASRGGEVLFVVHFECYTRLSPEERDALLGQYGVEEAREE